MKSLLVDSFSIFALCYDYMRYVLRMFVAVTSHYDVVLYIPVYYEGKIIDVKNTALAHVEHTIN